MELAAWQSVKAFVMVESCQLISLQPTRAIFGDSLGGVAACSSVEQERQALADLGYRDRRRPFFFPAVILARETR